MKKINVITRILTILLSFWILGSTSVMPFELPNHQSDLLEIPTDLQESFEAEKEFLNYESTAVYYRKDILVDKRWGIEAKQIYNSPNLPIPYCPPEFVYNSQI